MTNILMPFTRAVGGGSFISAALLAKGLRANGVNVLALFPEEGPSTEVFRKHNVPFRVLKEFPIVAAYSRTSLEALRFIGDFSRTYRAALQFLEAEKFDFVHLNDGTTVLPWGLAAKRRNLATIWHIRGGSIGYTDRLRLRLSGHRICISEFVKSRLPNGSTCHVLYNPAEASTQLESADRAALRLKLGMCEKACHLVHIGRDTPYKRPNWSVTAMRILADNDIPVTLTFLGDFTSERKKDLLEVLPEALQIHVRFPGWVSDPDSYLAASDVLLHPAKGEHFGRIFAEAALYNVPFVATPTGAAPELINAGLPGVAAQDDTEESFSAAVLAVANGKNAPETSHFIAPSWLEPAYNARLFLDLLNK